MYRETKCDVSFFCDMGPAFFLLSLSRSCMYAFREETSQTNVILQYKLLASILSAVCSVIQQS